MHANDYIDRVRDLPSLPELVMELQAAMQQEDIDTHALAERITLDSALTAKTLRLANSSFYGVQNKVTTIQQAVAVLGFHSIHTLVTACSVMTSFASDQRAPFDFAAFWRHATATAVCARVLAPYFRMNPENAFTAGLLHDIGKLVIATQFPLQYQQLEQYRLEHDCLALVAERAVLDVDHAMIGSALAAHWRFPTLIQQAVAGHHQAMAAGDELTLTSLIDLANVLAHALDLSGTPDDQVPPLALALWHALPLLDAEWDIALRDIEAMFGEMCQVLTP